MRGRRPWAASSIRRTRARRTRPAPHRPPAPATRPPARAAPTEREPSSERLDPRDELRDRVLGIAEEHHRLRVEVELVVDAREARIHAPLEHDDRLRVVDVE